MDEHAYFPERYRVYTSSAAAIEELPADSLLVKAVTKAFSQELKPRQVVVGRKAIDGVSGEVKAENSSLYSLTISGNVYEFTSSGSATAIEIVAGLKAAYELAPAEGVTFTDSLDGSFTLKATGEWSVLADKKITLVNDLSTETWAEAVSALSQATDLWYGLTITSHEEEDVLAVAEIIESDKKIFGTSTQDPVARTSSTTDILSKLKVLGYNRTFAIFSDKADTEYPEVALMAYQLQEQAGSNTWAYKTLSGVTAKRENGSATVNLNNKNAVLYEEIGGVAATVNGTMASGEFIDTMVFVDWLETRMQERLWFLMKNLKKIPYTDEGLALVEAQIRAQLQDGIDVGGLAAVPAPTVTVPKVQTIAPNLKARRELEGVTFEAVLAGAIHKIRIRGTVTV